MNFEITRDLELFDRLNDRAQTIVRRRLRAVKKIHALTTHKSASAACAAIASVSGGQRGWTPQSLYRIYKLFTESGGAWQSLVDASIAGKRWQSSLDSDALPAAFLDHVASEWALNQRDKFRAIYSRLLLRLERWRGGDENCAIPGLSSPPPPAPDSTAGLPAGWTESNLRLAVKKRVPKFTRRLIQRGPKAASELGPMILATREGKEAGQFIILDDSWEDFKVRAQGQTCRLLGFHALDLFSGANLMRGYKPGVKDENEIMAGLKNCEMIFLLAALFTSIGYRERGTVLICEKGTAQVREQEEQIFHDFGVPIKVQRGTAGGGPGIDALFTGPGGGNPRWKASLESWFNLQRNASAGLLEFPGQTGSYSSGLPMPEGLPGLERDFRLLQKLARTLPLDRAMLLQSGMLHFTEAVSRLHDLVELINCRTDHKLEGWRRCGHVVGEWRANEMLAWQPEQKLLEFQNGELAAIAAVLAANKNLKRERPLSPSEVLERGRSGLKKMPMTVAAVMLKALEKNFAECFVKRGVVEIGCPDLDPDEPLRYGLVRRDGRGLEESLREDEKFAAIVNPVAPAHAWLYHADGSFAGCAQSYADQANGRVDREDESALHRQFAKKRQYLAPLIADARRLASPLTHSDIARNAHNTARLADGARAEVQFDEETDAALYNALK